MQRQANIHSRALGIASRIFMVFLVLVGTGCRASGYDNLASETQVQPWRQLTQAWHAQDARTITVPTRVDEGPVVNIALHSIGAADASRTIVLVHGCFSDHVMWRFVVGDLARDSRMLLVDLPGCGRSDVVEPQRLGPAGYEPSRMAERVAQALEAWVVRVETEERATAAQHLTLVGHSMGGTVAMRLLGDDDLSVRHRELVNRVDRLILLAPADVEIPNPPEVFRRLATLGSAVIVFGQLTGLLREAMAHAQQDGVANLETPLREEVDRQCRILTAPSRRAVMQAMLRQALPLRDNGELDWIEAERIATGYRNITVPCLIVWGARDSCLPVAMGHKLAAAIPGASLEVVPACMHSPAIEQPYLCAAMIREFSNDPTAQRATARARQYAAQMNQAPIRGEVGAANVALGELDGH